jgi:hypothetical protein
MVMLVFGSILIELTGCTGFLQNPAGESMAPKSTLASEGRNLSDWQYWMSRVPSQEELEAAIANHMENLIDQRFFFVPPDETAPSEKIQHYRKAWEKELRGKLATAPEALLAHFVYFNTVDAYVKKQIDYEGLKIKYSKNNNRISYVEIRKLYQGAFDKLGIDTEAILKAGFDESWMKAEKIGTLGTGAHHAELNQNRVGDAMYRAPGGSSSSSWPSFGHAAIWRQHGDPYQYNDDSPVAMASWGGDPDPNAPLHERNGVGYDYRRCWSQSNTYGLRVKYDSGSDTSNYLAQGAESWAEYYRSQNLPYNWDFCNKQRIDAFYCSQLVWRCWKTQGIDIDSGDFHGWCWWWGDAVTPEEIYLDNNTRCMYHY